VLNRETIAGAIDHTLLSSDATYGDIDNLCKEALDFGFHSVCINPSFVKRSKDLLNDSAVKVTTVIGFPLGADLTDVKVYEAMNGALLGADELDIVINISALKSGDWKTVRKDLSDVIMATRGLIHKAIIETCYLNEDEKKKAVMIALDAGAEFIKTSTGFGPKGAEREDVRLIKSLVGDGAGIKAAGGIRTLKQVVDFIEAGATRIGTSSGVGIMREIQEGDFPIRGVSRN
jgi:deoxyribose-phosphate aldolase